jgi:prepilin-type N-terminal cleavage/methylation domain-containing protein
MKRPSTFPVSDRSADHGVRATRQGFTLVEMLVVITIIGILAGMITAAAIVAKKTAKKGACVMEVKQLEMACQVYKEKFGEYPPDFASINGVHTATHQKEAQDAILRHLARAFPRYQPGNWATLRTAVLNKWNLDINNLSPAGALTFWLGGKPDWLPDTGGDITLQDGTKVSSTKPVRGFTGFSANPIDPFDASASRIKPMYDFNVDSLKYSAGVYAGLFAWPTTYCDKSENGPLVYFRAENGHFTTDGKLVNQPGVDTTNRKDWSASNVMVYPAGDWGTQKNFSTFTWINPKSFQIFSSGADAKYGNVKKWPTGTPAALLYPGGDNYEQETYDDITNFAMGTLEDKIP